MEGLVLLAGRFRRHSLRHGDSRAPAGAKPKRLGLSLALIARAYAQPERDTRTPAGGASSPATSTSATPAGFSRSRHHGFVCRLYRRPL